MRAAPLVSRRMQFATVRTVRADERLAFVDRRGQRRCICSRRAQAGGEEGDSLRRQAARRRVVQREAVHNAAAFAESEAFDVPSTLDAFQRFTRPHTMIGTFLSVSSVSVMAMQGAAWSGAAWSALLLALVAALLANISIVGLNQCYDVDIDRVNKPYLPLASGEFSLATGWRIVLTTGVMSLAVAWATGSSLIEERNGVL